MTTNDEVWVPDACTVDVLDALAERAAARAGS
jgi:hypothetical protein